MAVALLTTYIHALLLCVLLSLTLQLSSSRAAAPDCGEPKTVLNAIVNVRKEHSADNFQYIQYMCQDGYKRRVGTSNLAICVLNFATQTAYWKYGNINCTKDESRPMTTHITLTSSTMHSTLMSSTTSDQQHYPTAPTTAVSATYIMDTTGSTSSVSSSSRDFTTSTKLERSTTTLLSAVTVKNDQTSRISKTKLNQQTQVPRHVSTTTTTTGYHHTTEGHTTHPAGPPSTTNTVGKGIVTTMTRQPRISEHASTSRKMTQSFPEYTYPPTDETLKLSTISYITIPGQDSNTSDTSWWQQEGTAAGSIGGILLILTPLVICFIIWIKRRKQHSRVPQEEPNPEQYCADLEEQEEESSNL